MTVAAPARVSRRVLARPRAPVLGVVGLLAAELLLAPLVIGLGPEGSRVAPYWPNVGLSVIALAFTSHRWRPAVALAILAVNLAGNYIGGRELDVSVGFGLANAVTPVVVIWWMARAGQDRPRLDTLEDLARLVGATAVAAILGGAVAGLTVAWLGSGDPSVAWRAVAAAYSAAILVIAPLGMAVPRIRQRAGPAEAGLQWGALTVVSVAVFGPGQNLPLAFVPFPLLVWGAFRLRPREVTVQGFAFAALISVMTTAGYGPFVHALHDGEYPPELVGTLLQSALLAAALVALPLALVRAQQVITYDRLRHSHDLVSNILEATTGTAIVGMDLEGRIEFFNTGAERLTGYPADEVVGRARAILVTVEGGEPTIHFAPEDQLPENRITGLLKPAFDAGERHVTTDWPWVRRDGEVRTVQVTVSRRYGDDGEPVGFLGVADDVTERRRHEAMVEAALETEMQIVERLAQVDQTKNDFLATVSHELRTPITSILGYSQLLLSDESGTLPTMHHQVVGRIERNGRRLMGLIEDMLMMSQVEVGTFHFDRAPVDLRQPVLDALEAVAPMLRANALMVESDLGPDEVRVAGDAAKLERVFTNLLSNAAKFSHPGDRIDARLTIEGDEAVFTVTDTGLGISLEDQAHLFDRFFRGADAHALAIQGVGLGLPIASSIVTGHEGRIDVASELGRGSTFVVRLPLLREDEEVTGATPSRAEAPEGAPPTVSQRAEAPVRRG